MDKMTVPGTGPGPNYDELAKKLTTAAPAVPDYDSLAKKLDQNSASVNLKSAAEVNPDKAAEAQKLAKITGLPTPAVEGNEDQVAAQVRYDDNVRRLTTAPATASFLSDPNNAKIAHDSVEQLVKSESAWGRKTGQPKPDNRWKSAGVDAETNAARAFGAEIVDFPGVALRGIGELYGVAENQVGARVSKGVQASLRAIGLTDFADALAEPVPWWVDPAQILKQPGEAIGAVAEDIRPAKEDRNLATDIAGGVGQVSAQITTAMLTGGLSSVVSLLTMAAQGADQQAKQIEESGAEKGDGTDAALVSGAAITILTERWGLGNLLDKIPAAIKTRLGRMVAGFGSEASQEVVEGVLQNLVALGLYDPTQQLFEGVERAGTVGGFVGMIVSAVIPGRQAINTRDSANEAAKALTSSPLYGRDPVAAATAYAQQMESVGFKEVHIPAAELAKVIDASEDPVALAKAMGVEGQMAEALALGGEVRLTAQQFAEHIVATDNYAALADFIRYGDNAMSAKDAEEYATTGVKDEVRSVAAAVSRDAEADPTLIHGTSKASANSIRKSGKFDVSKGERHYDYSTLGPNAVFFTTPGIEGKRKTWLGRTAGDRMAEYDDSVSALLSEGSKVKVFENAADVDSFIEDFIERNKDALSPAVREQWENRASNEDISMAGFFDKAVGSDGLKGEGETRSHVLEMNARLAKEWDALDTSRLSDKDLGSAADGLFGMPQVAVLNPAKLTVKQDAGDSVSQEPAEPDPVTLAEEQLGLQGLLTPDDMSKAQHEAYMLAVARSKDGARKRQARKILRQQERENDAAYKAEREKIETEVREEIAQLPVYAAMNSIGRERIDRDAMLALLPPYMVYNKETGENKMRSSKEQLNDLPKIGGRQIFAGVKQGGINPEILAEQHGFKSAREMIEAFMLEPSFEEAVRAQTDAVMKQRHGDILERATGLREAIESLHNDEQANLLAFELNQLREAKKEGRLKPALLRAEARKLIAERLIRDIRADQFLKNERKAGREAGVLLRKGDRAGAAAAKFRQLLNFQFVREAYAVRAEFKKQSKELKKLVSKGKDWSGVDAAFTDKVKALLEGYDFAKALKPDGTDMTWGEWQNLYAQAQALIAQGRAAKKYTLKGRQVELDWMVAEMTEQSDKLPTIAEAKERQKKPNPTFFRKSVSFVTRLVTESKKLELELQKMDGGVLGGIWHQSIFQRVSGAQTVKEDLRSEVLLPLMDELRKVWADASGPSRIQTALYDDPLTRAEVFMIALNMGNESNLQKLIDGAKRDGRKWTEADLLDAISNLSPEELAMVNKFWRTFDAMYPRVEAIFRENEGQSPEKVNPLSYSMLDKGITMEGGYFPIMYDPERRPPQKGKTLAELVKEETTAGVYSGMTKSRTGYAAPILLDPGQLARGIEQTLHFVAFYDTIRDLNNLLAVKEIQQAIENKLGRAMYEEMQEWVEALATNNQSNETTRAYNSAINYLRGSLTVGVMGGSYTTLMSQTLGLSTSVDVLGQKPGGGFSNAQGSRWMAVGLAAYAADPTGTVKMARRMSGEMRHRLVNTNREIAHALRRFQDSPSNAPGLKQFQQIQEASMMAIGGMQFFTVDMPTWLGGYHKALHEGKTEADAIEYADAVLRTSQSSGHLKDLAHIQRKPGWWRAATMFATFTILQYNRQLQIASGAKKIKNLPATVSRMAWMVVIPALGSMLLRGEWPDEDEEDVEGYFLAKMLAYTLSPIPVVGRLLSSAVEGHKPSLLALDMLGQTTARAFKAVDKIVFSEEETEAKDILAALTPLGYLAGVPMTSQAGRILSAVEAEDDADWYDFLSGYKDK